MMLLINLHPLKHSYVKFFGESNFAHIYLEKTYIFSEFLIISSLKCMLFFYYLMISYWFDVNTLRKINLHMSQNVVPYLQNVKKMAKNTLALCKILLYFA